MPVPRAVNVDGEDSSTNVNRRVDHLSTRISDMMQRLREQSERDSARVDAQTEKVLVQMRLVEVERNVPGRPHNYLDQARMHKKKRLRRARGVRWRDYRFSSTESSTPSSSSSSSSSSS